MKRVTARVFWFPDGVHRMISMTGWHWETYDKIIEQGVISDRNRFAEYAYKFAIDEFDRNSEDFEGKLQMVMQDFTLWVWKRKCNEKSLNNNGLLDHYT